MDYTGRKAGDINTEIDAGEVYQALIQTIREALSSARWLHTLGVVKAARRLARIFGADEQKATLAAYGHDFTKEWTDRKSADYVKKHGLPTRCLDYPEIAHGHVAADVLRQEHGINDEDILNAIRYHSTGRENMSLLEKIIYLADLTEEGRTYEGIEKIRTLAEHDLDGALALALREVIVFIRKKGKEPDESSVRALAYMTENEQVKEKRMDKMDNMQIAERIANVLDEKKGADIVTLDLSVKSSFCDYFIIVTGMSERQVKTLSEEVEDKMAEFGVPCKNVEGRSTGWILMDYGDIIVSIFTADQREKYNLEEIWTEVEHERSSTL